VPVSENKDKLMLVMKPKINSVMIKESKEEEIEVKNDNFPDVMELL
jgi:hypothetical protein